VALVCLFVSRIRLIVPIIHRSVNNVKMEELQGALDEVYTLRVLLMFYL